MREPPVQPRVALVTGGGRGLGAAISESLVRAGWAVALAGRSPRSLEDTADRLRGMGGTLLSVPTDVTSADAVDRLVSAVAAELGEIDALINNAGCTEYSKVWEADPEAWWRVVEVNLLGPFLCARAVLPGMVARGGGYIVNVSSIAAAEPAQNQTAYSASKAALVRLTDSLAAQAGSFGVRVFAISPGPVKSDMGLEVAARSGAPKWVAMTCAADLIRQLLSGEFDQLTGRFIHVTDNIEDMRRRASEVIDRDLYQLRVRRL